MGSKQWNIVNEWGDGGQIAQVNIKSLSFTVFATLKM
jgi:hypothetical protein